MEFWKANYFDTTSSMTITAGSTGYDTSTSRNHMLPDLLKQLHITANQFSFTIKFNQTLTISRLALAEHNLKNFRLYYDGVTANTFALTAAAGTTVSNWDSNSATAHYLACTPVACTSVSMDINSCTTGLTRALGYFAASDLLMSFDKIPDSTGFDLKRNFIGANHRLSDGSSRAQEFGQKWEANIRLSHISSSFRNSLYDVFALHDDFIFVPFGTGTTWDSIIFPCNWVGAFGFHQVADNAKASGYSGVVRLKEAPV